MKRLLLITTCLFLFDAVFAQAPPSDWQWAKRLNSSSFTHSRGIGTDLLGNTYVTGFFQETLQIDSLSYPGSVNHNQPYLAKFDVNGNTQWVKTISTNANMLVQDIAVSESGHTVIFGSFNGPANFGPVSISPTHMDHLFIATYDQDGNLLFAKPLGVSGVHGAQNVAFDPWGNIILSGSFLYSIQFDGHLLTSLTDTSPFVAKLDANGNTLWARKGTTGSLPNHINSLATDLDGNCYLTGNFIGSISFGSLTASVPGGFCYYLIKFDASGNEVWIKRFTGVFSEGRNQLTADKNGNLYFSGASNLSVNFGNLGLGNMLNSLYLVKFSAATGDAIWLKRLIGQGGTYNHGMATDNSGNTFLLGRFLNNMNVAGTTLINQGNSDLLVAKYDNHGSLLWVTSAGSATYDDPTAITADNYGNCTVTGTFYSPVVFGNLSLVNQGVQDSFIARIGDFQVNAMPGSNSNPDYFFAFPNPFETGFTLRFTSTEVGSPVKIKVFNLLGQVVWSSDLLVAAENVPVVLPKQLMPGTYLLEVRRNGQRQTLKLQKN